MKNNKGFTMVELLATLVILLILFSVGAYTLIKSLDNSKEEAYKIQIKEFEEVTKTFIADNLTKIPELQTPATPYNLTLKDLNTGGYIELPIKNPRTGEHFVPENLKITITKLENNNYKIDIVY